MTVDKAKFGKALDLFLTIIYIIFGAICIVIGIVGGILLLSQSYWIVSILLWILALVSVVLIANIIIFYRIDGGASK